MKILDKERLHKLSFDMPKMSSKLTARQLIMLNRVEEELSFASNVAKVDEIEL